MANPLRALVDFFRPAPDEPPYRTEPVPYKPGTERRQWGDPPPVKRRWWRPW